MWFTGVGPTPYFTAEPLPDLMNCAPKGHAANNDFRPRCPYATQTCRKEEPPVSQSGTHWVRCHLYDATAQLRRPLPAIAPASAPMAQP